MGKWRNKYSAVRTGYRGCVYDSKAEATRAQELDLLVECGEIDKWTPQPKFVLAGCVSYRADFAVWTGGVKHIEDVKGVETSDFKIKKLLWANGFGPTCSLIILKRHGNGWKREEVRP